MISLNPGLLVGGYGVVGLLLQNHSIQRSRVLNSGTLCHLLLGLLSSWTESRQLGNWRTPEILDKHDVDEHTIDGGGNQNLLK